MLARQCTGPDGSALTFEDTVNYSLPPPEGDSSSAHRLRDDRHLQREREAILRLDERVEARISWLEVQEALQAQAAELKVEAAKIKARATRRIAKLKEERAELEKESRLAQQRRQGHLLQEQSSLLPQPEPPMQPQLQLKEAEEYQYYRGSAGRTLRRRDCATASARGRPCRSVGLPDARQSLAIDHRVTDHVQLQ